jgi:hypothetical protein
MSWQQAPGPYSIRTMHTDNQSGWIVAHTSETLLCGAQRAPGFNSYLLGRRFQEMVLLRHSTEAEHNVLSLTSPGGDAMHAGLHRVQIWVELAD